MLRASSGDIAANNAATSALLSPADVVPDRENTLKPVFAPLALLSDMATYTTVTERDNTADNLSKGYLTGIFNNSRLEDLWSGNSKSPFQN